MNENESMDKAVLASAGIGRLAPMTRSESLGLLWFFVTTMAVLLAMGAGYALGVSHYPPVAAPTPGPAPAISPCPCFLRGHPTGDRFLPSPE